MQTNQNSPFKEEQGGEATLGHIVFKEGSLFVSKKETKFFKKYYRYITH